MRQLLQYETENSYQTFIAKYSRRLLQCASGITKCDRSLLQSVSIIIKCNRSLLRSALGITKRGSSLLQSASGITKCDHCYKVRRNFSSFIFCCCTSAFTSADIILTTF